MMTRRFMIVALFALASGRGCITVAGEKPATSDAIRLTVPAGVPLHVILEKSVPIKDAGAPVAAQVVDPIFVFNHLVTFAKNTPMEIRFGTHGGQNRLHAN